MLSSALVLLAKPEKQSKSNKREDRQVRYLVNRRVSCSSNAINAVVDAA